MIPSQQQHTDDSQQYCCSELSMCVETCASSLATCAATACTGKARQTDPRLADVPRAEVGERPLSLVRNGKVALTAYLRS